MYLNSKSCSKPHPDVDPGGRGDGLGGDVAATHTGDPDCVPGSHFWPDTVPTIVGVWTADGNPPSLSHSLPLNINK